MANSKGDLSHFLASVRTLAFLTIVLAGLFIVALSGSARFVLAGIAALLSLSLLRLVSVLSRRKADTTHSWLLQRVAKSRGHRREYSDLRDLPPQPSLDVARQSVGKSFDSLFLGMFYFGVVLSISGFIIGFGFLNGGPRAAVLGGLGVFGLYIASSSLLMRKRFRRIWQKQSGAKPPST